MESENVARLARPVERGVGHCEVCGRNNGEHELVPTKVMMQELQRALDELALYFTSGNGTPSERATILANDFWRITGKRPNARVQPPCAPAQKVKLQAKAGRRGRSDGTDCSAASRLTSNSYSGMDTFCG